MNQTVFWEKELLKKEKVETVQINLGNLCNQACAHCHIAASPAGNRNMDRAAAEKILAKLLASALPNLEFTGGAPEMNPHLPLFIEELSKAGRRLTVRTNLTILEDPAYAWLADVYRRNGVRLVASLPSAFEDLTDSQRGRGVFETSIRVLKKLNERGYGTKGLQLDLVHNSPDDHLPPGQEKLERDYKQILVEQYGVVFSRLLTIVNTPINRFRQYLENCGRLDSYLRELKDRFNPDTLARIMCRSLISVDYDGNVYDCDFNLALGIRIKGYENAKLWDIDFSDFTPEITCAEHCYACTVNEGSSCRGALVGRKSNDLDADFDAKHEVKNYYTDVVQRTTDLKTTACCTPESMPAHVRAALPYVADEIKERYYGCGSPIPQAVNGLSVLDLGCGTGRDSYIMAKLVGEEGSVTGIDMTEAQIRVADKYLDIQRTRFGYSRANTRFIFDEIENAGRHFRPESLDLVISNCVINLVEDKETVMKQIFRLLRNGGELYFSDIYADRRIPSELGKNPVLYGECLGGALYEKDFIRLARRSGFPDPRVMSRRVIDITNTEILERTGNIRFSSVTYRLWKLEGLEDACEDYGHIAVYRGGIPEAPHRFLLDAEHVFEKDRPERVCGNTALMLSKTRLENYFEVMGNFDIHFGAFTACGTAAKAGDNPDAKGSCC